MSDQDRVRLLRAVLRDGFGRIEEGVREVVDGLTPEDLTWQPVPGANPVGWLVWHLSRQQDAQLAQVAGTDQVWRSGGWRERFDLPYRPDEMGYGQDPEEVASLRVEDPALLVGYAEAVADLSRQLLEGLGPSDYERVIDEDWDPPVTVATRVYSVLEDAAKHLGQAECLVGMLSRARGRG